MEKKQKKKLLLDYLYDNLKNHNWWAYRYFFCELLALLNVIGSYNVCCKKQIFNMEIIKPNESFLSPADIIGKLYSNYFKSNLIATKSTKGVIKNAVKV